MVALAIFGGAAVLWLIMNYWYRKGQHEGWKAGYDAGHKIGYHEANNLWAELFDRRSRHGS